MQINCNNVRIMSWYFDGNLAANDYYESRHIDLDDIDMFTIEVDGYEKMRPKEAVLALAKNSSKHDGDCVLRLKFVKELGQRGRFEIRSNLYGSEDLLDFIYFEVAHLDEMCDLRRELEEE